MTQMASGGTMQADLPTVDKLLECCDARDGCTISAPADAVPLSRPLTRADCASVPRPCPFVSCKYHLLVEVDQVMGLIHARNSHLTIPDCGFSCALDVAEVRISSIEELSEIMGRDPQYLDETMDRAERKIRIHSDDTNSN